MAISGMTKFFKEELENLKMKTGFNQFENLKQDPAWKEKANDLVRQLVQETERPPFDKIKVEVIQRILMDGVMNDKDFIGWNPKWVRMTLNNWWGIYGGKIIEARTASEKQNMQAVPYEGPPIDVDTLINSYLNTLKSAPMMRSVPKVTEVEANEEGQDRPKAHIYRSTDRSYLNEVNARVRKGRELYFRENYPGATEEQVKEYLDSFKD